MAKQVTQREQNSSPPYKRKAKKAYTTTPTHIEPTQSMNWTRLMGMGPSKKAWSPTKEIVQKMTLTSVKTKPHF